MLLDLDIEAALGIWNGDVAALPEATRRALRDLWDGFHKETWTAPQRIEKELALSPEAWLQQALPLGHGQGHETQLVDTLRALVEELQRDARRLLDGHLARCAEYDGKARFLRDDDSEPAEDRLNNLRGKVPEELARIKPTVGLNDADIEEILSLLVLMQTGTSEVASWPDLEKRVLEIVNAARRRKALLSGAGEPRSWDALTQVSQLRGALENFAALALEWQGRSAHLRRTYQADLTVRGDFLEWQSLVQETMLGGLDDEARRAEFALQAAYVVFIRLLLIRVCEDKGIFPHRFLSNGGLEHWQEDIKRYLVFANGNPYEPLLDMAYKNAQNIYAHFFTGRELFNWFRLDQRALLLALHRLSKFNFAGVDSDIVGTVYNTYVNRPEKRKKGQYYTPPPIVNYILDSVGYTGSAVIGDNKRLLDPACGSGTFLVQAAKRLVNAYRDGDGQIHQPQRVLERVRNNLVGFDLNPFACYLAEVNLLIQVLDLVKIAIDAGQRPRINRFNVYNVDALTRATGMLHAARFGSLMAEESDEVDDIKSRRPGSPHANGFAFVVANPPYLTALSADYKAMLKADWPDVWRGQPDTYVFFLKLGLELLATGGKLGFITPNTYLMGTNSGPLRVALLRAGRIEEIVDLPQGIWHDATVDCVLLFLTQDSYEAARRTQTVQVHLLQLNDELDKLVNREWGETLTQSQADWLDHPRNEMNIRYDALLAAIENACLVQLDVVGSTEGLQTKVLRLGDVIDSCPGIDPYATARDGRENTYIKPRHDIPSNAPEWRPLLDTNSFVGRYELRWAANKPHIKYGDWLSRAREPKFFEEPKLLFIRLRNRSLARLLVATYDEKQFFNRKNFSNIIAKDSAYDLKYLLALFNSSLLNFWYARRYPDVEISIADTNEVPIYPADAVTQARLVGLVDELLRVHEQLNIWRAAGDTIGQRRDGMTHIMVAFDTLLAETQGRHPDLQTLRLFDAEAAELFTIPATCNRTATISGNVSIPHRAPTPLPCASTNSGWMCPMTIRGAICKVTYRGPSGRVKPGIMLPTTLLFQPVQKIGSNFSRH
ncbi:MAG: N-6 DNA methylase [Abitibacteriaceae bacterium]|nr:N-6 DNA methylase [Abditibacteriaceae bacterium]